MKGTHICAFKSTSVANLVSKSHFSITNIMQDQSSLTINLISTLIKWEEVAHAYTLDFGAITLPPLQSLQRRQSFENPAGPDYIHMLWDPAINAAADKVRNFFSQFFSNKGDPYLLKIETPKTSLIRAGPYVERSFRIKMTKANFLL